MGKESVSHRDVMGKPEGKKPPGSPRHKRDDTKKGRDGLSWTGLICLRIGLL
jgi:hypothetical protein